MKYDFTSIIDRHGKDAIAVDGLGSGEAPGLPKEGFDVIPYVGGRYELSNCSQHSGSSDRKSETPGIWLFCTVRRVF